MLYFYGQSIKCCQKMWKKVFHSTRTYQHTLRRLLLLLALFVFVSTLLLWIHPSGPLKHHHSKRIPTESAISKGEWGSSSYYHWGNSDWNTSRRLEDRLDCGRVFDGDRAYARENIFYTPEPTQDELPMDCESIQHRSELPPLDWTASEEEMRFPLAFARVVYKDYLFLERELAVNYAAQNWYCYSVDAKADALFQWRMRQLASCLPNVFVSRRQFAVTGQGHNTSNAMVECARELASTERKWHYLLTLQNHDLQAKTNAEMVRILGWLDGANDIEVGGVAQQQIRERMDFLMASFQWDFQALQLFKNETKNSPAQMLRLSKGYCSASLSRAFVDFVVHQLNVDNVLRQLNEASFGVDEHLWQSLSTTDALDLPGGFPQHCYDQLEMKTPFITRFAVWEGAETEVKCRSGQWRHAVCVFGLKDLTRPGGLLSMPHLFVNKMMPEFDAGAIKCWHQRMRHRRLARSEGKLDPKAYVDWPQTRYNRMKREKKEAPIGPKEFKCD